MNMRYSHDARITRWNRIMKNLVLLAGLVALPFCLVGALLVGRDGVRAGVLVAVALMGVAYLVSQRVVLRLCYATPADVEHHPALVQLVEALAHSANIRTPLVAVSALNVPNAFAAMTPGGG